MRCDRSAARSRSLRAAYDPRRPSERPRTRLRARRARRRGSHWRGSGVQTSACETKPDLTPVTEADRAAEEAIRERLDSCTPGRRRRRRGVRRHRRGGRVGAGSSIRSTAPRATSAGSRCGRRCSLCRSGTRSCSESSRRRRCSALVGRPRSGAFANRAPRIHVSAVQDLADAQLVDLRVGRLEAIGRLDAILELSRRAGAPAASATSGPTCWSPKARSTSAARARGEALGSGGADGDRGGGGWPVHRPRGERARMGAAGSRPTGCCTTRRSRSWGSEAGAGHLRIAARDHVGRLERPDEAPQVAIGGRAALRERCGPPD